jgi:hypothetical protein
VQVLALGLEQQLQDSVRAQGQEMEQRLQVQEQEQGLALQAVAAA